MQQLDAMILDLETLVVQAEANAAMLGPCAGYQSYGPADGTGIVSCMNRGEVYLSELELAVCKRCLRRGSY
jgi:hypothetical protein